MHRKNASGIFIFTVLKKSHCYKLMFNNEHPPCYGITYEHNLRHRESLCEISNTNKSHGIFLLENSVNTYNSDLKFLSENGVFIYIFLYCYENVQL